MEPSQRAVCEQKMNKHNDEVSVKRQRVSRSTTEGRLRWCSTTANHLFIPVDYHFTVGTASVADSSADGPHATGQRPNPKSLSVVATFGMPSARYWPGLGLEIFTVEKTNATCYVSVAGEGT